MAKREVDEIRRREMEAKLAEDRHATVVFLGIGVSALRASMHNLVKINK